MPNTPWDMLVYGGVSVMIAAPILFYPFAKIALPGARFGLPPPWPGINPSQNETFADGNP